MSEIDFYDCDHDAEELTHKSIDEAICAHLDQADVASWPTILKVYGWRRETYTFDAERILADALEAADDEHANPNGDGTEPTPAMIEAAEAFAAVLNREYEVWTCERVLDPIVRQNVAEWIIENERDWLDEPEIAAWVDAKRGGAA